jgi:hypothetical protein
MEKLSIAVTIVCALVLAALTMAAGGGEAAVVEHNFVVSTLYVLLHVVNTISGFICSI